MKKDFSQPLIPSDSTSFHLLVQDDATGRFLVTRPDDENEDDFYNVLHFTLENKATNLAHELAKFLYISYGYSLISFRELVRVTRAGWSFVDETPGSYGDDVCLHVVADIPSKTEEIVNGEVRSLVDPEKLLEHLIVGPYGDNIDMLGIAQLINEERVLKA